MIMNKYQSPLIEMENTTDINQQYYFLEKNKPTTNYYKTNTNLDGIRNDFPIFRRKVNNKDLIWLDNGATTQKPLCVIESLNKYYKTYNSNVHRGAHTLAGEATEGYEEARRKAQEFLGAASPEEIVFVRGATEAINLVAKSYGKMIINKGDEILLTTMEHHSNIVPWQELAKEMGATIKVIPINDRGEVIMSDYLRLLTPHTRIVALSHVSNVLGTINPIQTMTQMAHSHGATVLVDGAQAAPHLNVDVQSLDAEFYVMSGHKAYGPTGIGVLYGKKALLEAMPPWQSGGGMIKNVTFNKTEYEKVPEKFEAGTGNIADAIGLGYAIDYINKVGLHNIENHERELTGYAMKSLARIPNLKLIGTASNKISVISFLISTIAPDKVAHFLNEYGIATRSGHHCAQPTLARYGLTSINRASLGMYNTKHDIDKLVEALCQMINHG